MIQVLLVVVGLLSSAMMAVAQPLPVLVDQGAAGATAWPVSCSATDLDVRNLAKTQDEVYAVLRTDAGTAYDARARTWALDSGTDAVSCVVTSVSPGASASNVGKAEDAAHGSGDIGVMLLAVRRDTAAAGSDADGDYSTLNVDASGRLWINCGAGCAGGSQYTEGDVDTTITGTALMWEDSGDTLRAVSAATPLPVNSELPAAAALADGASAAPTTPTVGAVPLLMNATTVDRQRAVVHGLDSTGTGIAAAAIVAEVDDVATTAVSENQFGPVRMSSRRALLVEGVSGGTAVPVSGTVTTTPPANASTNVAQFGGANVVTGTGASGAGIPRVTLSTDSSLAANQSMNVAQIAGVSTATGSGKNSTGTQRVSPALDSGVCNPVDTSQVAVNVSTSGNNEIVALASGQTIYVCDVTLVANGTVEVQLVYGTGTACATGETDMTGAMPFILNTGWTHDYQGRLKTAAANALCIELSAGVAVRGVVTYRQATTF
jgi:hypothetical protein